MVTSLDRASMSDLQKIDKLSENSKNIFIEFVAEESEFVKEALDGHTCCRISEWFKAYISNGEMFGTLDENEKRMAFEQYERLKTLLQFVDDTLAKEKIGVYNIIE